MLLYMLFSQISGIDTNFLAIFPSEQYIQIVLWLHHGMEGKISMFMTCEHLWQV